MIASSSDKSEQCILTLAARPGRQIPVDLRDTTTDLGERNIQRPLTPSARTRENGQSSGY